MIGALALISVLGGGLAAAAIEFASDDTDGTPNDDTLTGGNGNDTFVGGDGHDLITGGLGEDRLLGQDGSDTVSGGSGNDTVAMGNGNDYYGFDGTNLVDESGNDLVRGGGGSDWLQDSSGADTLYGGLGDDIVVGAGDGTDDQADYLSGGYGDDVILGDNGDTIFGGAGEDSFGVLFTFGNGDAPVTLLDFDPLNEPLTIAVSNDMVFDTLEWQINFDEATGAATIQIWGMQNTEGGPVEVAAETAVILQNMTAETAAAVTLTLSDSLDELTPEEESGPQQLSWSDDLFNGTGSNEDVRGQYGNDTLYGAAGNDTLGGGDGDDSLSGDEGNDRLVGNSGNDSISGGAGDDTVVMGSGNDVYGYDGTNATSEAGDDTVRGGQGNDRLQDAEGANTLYGGLGNDTVIGAVETGTDTTADILSGGYGSDLVIGDNGDTMSGGEGIDDFGVGFDFGAGSAPVTITDLVAETESITIGVSADMALASMDWSVSFDPATGVATIDIWGAEDTGSGPTFLPAETAIVLQNMTAAAVANISIAFTA